MKKFAICFTLIVLVVFGNTSHSYASYEDSEFNGGFTSEEQEKENDKAVREKEDTLRSQNLLVDNNSIENQLLPRVVSGLSTRGGFYSNKKLPITRVVQENDYYCGPTAAKMVLDHRGIIKTQKQIATAIGTTSQYGSATANISTYLASMTGFNYVTQKISTRPIENVKSTLDVNRAVIYNVRTDILNKSYTFSSGHFVTGIGYQLYTYTDISPTSIDSSPVDISNTLTPRASNSYVTGFYYLDPWYKSYAAGEKFIIPENLTNAIVKNNGIYIW